MLTTNAAAGKKGARLLSMLSDSVTHQLLSDSVTPPGRVRGVGNTLHSLHYLTEDVDPAPASKYPRAARGDL